MKKIVLAIAAALMMSTSMFAQNNEQSENRQQKRPDMKEMIQKRTDAVVKKYNLDEKQAKQLLELNTKYADTMRPGFGPRMGGPRGGNMGRGNNAQQRQERPQLTDEQKAKFEEERKQRMEKMKAYDEELSKILTADQLKSYKADMQRRGPRGGEGRGPRGQRPNRQQND